MNFVRRIPKRGWTSLPCDQSPHDLQTNTSIQNTYMRFYSVSAPPAFDKVLPAYSCAILHTTLEEFEKCQKTGDPVPAASPRPNKANEQDQNKSASGHPDGLGRQRSPSKRTLWHGVVSGPILIRPAARSR